MRVRVEQLVPGCVVIRDIYSKTTKPIVPKNTVLTEEHIKVLERFLIEQVDVAHQLADGQAFNPKKLTPKEKKEQSIEIEARSFKEHYQYVVTKYKALFTEWQQQKPIDVAVIRKWLVPLLERQDDINQAVYTLHHYAGKETYFYHHSVALSVLSTFLAKKMGYSKAEYLQVGIAALLCDCGMSKLNPTMLMSTDSLTGAEFKEIKKHPVYSYRFVEHIPTITKSMKLAVLQHHERCDGSGYPLGLTTSNIHPYARIIAVCDIYHAMTCERPYQEKRSSFQVIEEIQKEQFSTLDVKVVQTFMKSLSNFSIGTKVKLSNDQIGEIVFVESEQPTRPMIRISDTDHIISLKDETNLYIDELLSRS
ncbi:HD-GYP domain-containing protein [Oceanobacillus halotolerans]|uniref:HD-GYP domain-containing protein n=1 Tax=Oceanobacillus halotolerans TaxID=2663380 RepID=UPI0013D7436B|nr:HD-GYP domain-containing protein [Oceanobacillus halotolerans]